MGDFNYFIFFILDIIIKYYFIYKISINFFFNWIIKEISSKWKDI